MRIRWPNAILLLALIGCLTPIYSLSFLGLVAVVAIWSPWRSAFFASYFTRFVAQSLLFGALIMVTGMYAWLMHVPVSPLAVALVYILCYWCARRFFPSVAQQKFINRQDILAASTALIGVGIVLMSFYIPKPSLGSSVQIITNGFDNAAHLSLINTTHAGNGYVYGPYDEVKDHVAWKTLTAYPQGWHLTTMMLWQGTGAPVFTGKDIGLSFNFYIATLLAWLFIAIFMTGRVALHIAELLGARIKRVQTVAAFCIANVAVQLLLFWGSLYFGFAPFIGTLAYFALLSTFLMGAHEEKSSAVLYYLAALLCAAAIGLSWLLPVAVALAMIGLHVLLFIDKSFIKTALAHKKHFAASAVGTLLLMIPILSMVLISANFSTQGKSQINDEGGIFSLSQLFVLLMLGSTAWYIFLRGKKKLPILFLSIVAPQLVFTALIYFYQMETIGHTAYFFTKSLALSLGLLSVFSIAALVSFADRLQFPAKSALLSIIASVVMVSGGIMLTGQDTFGLKGVLRRDAQMEPATATAFAGLAQNGQLMERNVIVFTKVDTLGGDVTGNVLSTALNTRIEPCIGDAIWLITDHRGEQFPKWINDCATSNQQKITVITSEATDKLITQYHNPHIQTILAP